MNPLKKINLFLLILCFSVSLTAQDAPKPAADDAAAIAKKLANPIGA
jgi:hypothetical protein